MSSAWPRILIDPVERRVKPMPEKPKYWQFVASAAIVSIGGALVLALGFWELVS